jgi:3D (Asp-Asp-Asp) domain-containing protein
VFRPRINKLPRSLPLLVVLLLALIAAPFNPGRLAAEALNDFFSNIGGPSPAVISDEALAAMEVLDTGWPSGQNHRSGARILLADSEVLIRLPSEYKNDSLMVPLEHFSLVTGCTFTITADQKVRLMKDNREYLLEADSPWLISGDDIWAFPIQPYEAHKSIYVPLRFLCGIMNIDVQWRQASATVLLAGYEADPQSLASSLAAANRVLLAALEDEEYPKLGEAQEIVITFYYSSAPAAWTASGNEAIAGSVAADPSIPFGAQYYIPELAFVRDDALFTVHDRGSAVRGNVLDIYLPNSVLALPAAKEALWRGRYTVTAYPVIPAPEELS